MKNKEEGLYKKIYQYYSPLKTNKTLVNTYQKITKDYEEVEDIRLQINNLISKNYLNENVIKSAFVKRYLIKKNPETNITIFELRANGSRADLCLFNDDSFVFEIKTEYDSYDRLEKQLNDYKALFDFLFVIIPEKEKENIKKQLTNDVGIITYKQNRLKNVVFNLERDAKRNSPLAMTQLKNITKKDLLILTNNKDNHKLPRELLMKELKEKNNRKQINNIYKNTIKNKYYKRWNYLHNIIDKLYFLDYQWFFKNNIDYEIIYR